MKKILLVSCGGFDNFGDEAMFNVLRRKLTQAGHEVTMAYYHFDVDKAKKRYPDVKVKKMLSIPRKLGVIRKNIMKNDMRKYSKKYDMLYFPGSGNFTSLYSTHIENIFYLVESFKKEAKYVEFRPQSVGPFFGKKKDLDESYTRKIIEASDKFFVRDAISYDFLKEQHSNIELLPDDAWAIQSIRPDTFMGEDHFTEKRLIGISIRPFRGEKEYLEKWFENLVSNLIQQGYTPFFIPICYSDRSAEYHDNYFLRDVLNNNKNVIFLEDIVDISDMQPENIKYFISLCESCIGLSYHFNVFSLAEEKPIVSLYYEDYYKVKNLGLQKAFGDEQNVINPLQYNVTETLELINIAEEKKRKQHK